MRSGIGIILVSLISLTGLFRGLPPVFNAVERYMEKELDVGAEVIYHNICIDGADVGGCTTDEAALIAEEAAQARELAEIVFTDGVKRTVFTLREVGLECDVLRAVTEALSYGRAGTLAERYRLVKELDTQRVCIPLGYDCDLEALRKKIADLAKAYGKEPVEPRIEFTNGKVMVREGEKGRAVDDAELYECVLAMLLGGRGGTAELPFNVLEPKFSVWEIRRAASLIGSYVTPLDSAAANRLGNVALAASRLNGTVVMPGESFSAGKCFNPDPRSDNGYLPAGSYVDGRVVDSVGGGICQVATTLYMALLYAELDVTQRNNHTMPVSYVDFAFDAAVAGDYFDLKFKNNTELPITLECYVKDGGLCVNVYGAENRPGGRSLNFESEMIEGVQPPYKYGMYKMVYDNGELMDRVLVNISEYKALHGRPPNEPDGGR